MEDHSSQPAPSFVPDQSFKLSLRLNQDPFPDLHALGGDRTGTGLIPVFVSWDAWATWIKFSSWKKPSAPDRVLDLAGRVCERRNSNYHPRQHHFTAFTSS